MKLYKGHKTRELRTMVTTVENGQTNILSPNRSWQVAVFLDDAFEWGSTGPGADQLSLALLLDRGLSNEEALKLGPQFKFSVVASLANDWVLTGEEIDLVIEQLMLESHQEIK